MRARTRLSDELGSAARIKSRANRLSVHSALTSALERLKQYTRLPPNGLALFCGTVAPDGGKERKMCFDFEPFRPISTSVYHCDARFKTEPLRALLSDDKTFGFVVMDGNGCLFGKLSGNSQTVLHRFSVNLPKKHGRGGQSALRFARLREEKRHNYIRKCAEAAVAHFISSDRPNVCGLVLAGSASLKTELAGSDLFDLRLKKIVVATVDVSYGGTNGFNQAIELAAEALGDVKLLEEKKLLSEYYGVIARDGNVCFGVADTMLALQMGAVGKLIVHEDLDIHRVVLNSAADDSETRYLTPSQFADPQSFVDKETGAELETMEQSALVEYLAENHKTFGCDLNFVNDSSHEGAQFVAGFGGIGGILRWAVDFQEPLDAEAVDDNRDDSEEEIDLDFLDFM